MFFSRVLQLKDNVRSELFNEEMVDLTSTTYTLPEDFEATIVTIGPDEVARPDLLSKILYSDEMYADILCKINGISNPYELNEGMKIVCPSMEDLNRFVLHPSKAWKEDIIGGNLRSNYLDGEDITLGKDAWINKSSNPIDENIPVQKHKNNTHKPNESLVGDRRFAIKGAENVVIY